MHVTLSTIATTALLFAAADAFPYRPHGTGVGQAHGTGRPHGTGIPSGRPHGTGVQSGPPQGTGVPEAQFSGLSFSGASGRNSTGKGGKGKGKGRFSGIPSGGFPSGIPTALPSGFPTNFPSGFPTNFPSGFPTNFPSGGISAVPSGPAPTDAPSAAPSNTELPSVSSVSFQLPDDAVVNAAKSTKKATSTKEATKTSASLSSPTGSTGNSTSGTSGSTKASSTFPEAAGESTLSEVMSVTGTFDGGLVRFGRGVTCGGQSEGGDSDAVFNIQEGGTLKNVIIGADQGEGVHCQGACTLENVWWEAVCEDAFTIKVQDASATTYIIGGGAKGAEDKVLQHNGAGTLNVKGFYVEDFGKMYRSCGNCKTSYERHIVMDSIIADGGSSTLVGINPNFGDTATITNSCITNTDKICTEFKGVASGSEPTELTSGISSSCIYTEADVTAC